MKNLVRISDLAMDEIEKIFSLAGKLEDTINPIKALENKTFVLIFPNSSIRTRVTFEKGIVSLGGQAILFPSETLDKKEEIKDVVSYLANWADGIIVRHSDINLIDKMCKYSKIPVINAMTKENHPCEILTDLYSISKLRKNYLDLNYTFVGAAENIGKAWVEASGTFGFNLTQVCPKELEIDSDVKTFKTSNTFDGIIENTDIVLTDPISKNNKELMAPYQITADLMSKARPNALLNPCPPFYRGEEVSADVIDSPYFVGYEFKKALLYVQQAIILYCSDNADKIER